MKYSQPPPLFFKKKLNKMQRGEQKVVDLTAYDERRSIESKRKKGSRDANNGIQVKKVNHFYYIISLTLHSPCTINFSEP